tara:strand:- start:1 stop:618 length:618 start_codon:yes stop_codon:yes gene_type:complete
LKNREQIESELRKIIKKSKKGVFVKLTLTNLIEISRRMYVIYENFKSGEKLKIKNNDENLLILNNVLSDFKKLNKDIDKIPNYLRELIDRKWEQTPNTKKSVYGSTNLLQGKLQILEEEFKNLIDIFSEDLKDGAIKNIDPTPIAIIHSAMIIWEEELKNKYNKKNKKIINKSLLKYLEQVFDAFSCDADIKSNYYNWHNLKNMS